MSIEADPEQRAFIQSIIDRKETASVFLCNGIKLVGPIYRQSDHVIEMGTPKSQDTSLVYTKSISTIQVSH